MSGLCKLLRRLLSDESGQSLVVVVSSMTVLLGVAAFGIDAATWMAKHHQAQVVADSAALAAAQCLAIPGHPETIVLTARRHRCRRAPRVPTQRTQTRSPSITQRQTG